MCARTHANSTHHQLFELCYQEEAWLHQKQQVASDESYRDPSNLQSKIQKHAAFELELSANRGRVGAVTAEGEALIGAGHFASMEIQAQLNELEAAWCALQDSSLLKRDRLRDAYQVQLTLLRFQKCICL
jgi:spectrin beta